MAIAEFLTRFGESNRAIAATPAFRDFRNSSNDQGARKKDARSIEPAGRQMKISVS